MSSIHYRNLKTLSKRHSTLISAQKYHRIVQNLNVKLIQLNVHKTNDVQIRYLFNPYFDIILWKVEVPKLNLIFALSNDILE